MTFEDFKLNPRLIEGLDSMGFQTPTPIQEQAIPTILEGQDLIACAQTGTGKTAAFLLPVIHKSMDLPSENEINTLIITPTRELAIQIDQQMEGLAYFTGVSSLAIYGGGDGSSFEKEKSALINGADVIVGTPGRLISHLNLGYVKIGALKHLVLDEADRMMDMGFNDDIMKIISFLPGVRQNLMFSATMPPKIRNLAKQILNDNPFEINIAISKPAAGIFQAAFMVYDNQKPALAGHLLKAKQLQSVIVFSSTKSNVKALDKELRQLGFGCEAIHSDLDQDEREAVLRRFKNRDFKVLVATDILSRGIDIEGIDLVVNYDVPGDGEDYIHRIGRTARAASKGVAFTFVNEKDQQKFFSIEQLLEKEIPKAKLPAHIGEGPKYAPKKRGGSKHHGRKRTNQRRKKK